MTKTHPSMRLDRLLSNLGYGSRKEMIAAIRNGWVTVGGVDVTDPGYAVPLDRSDTVRLDGEAIDLPPPMTVMLHKPAGYTCSHNDLGALVYDLLPDRWRIRKPPLSTVGRLDKESTGQLLLTDDGDLLHRITHPRSHAAKHYRVTLRDPLRGDETALFAAGGFVMNGDARPLKPATWTPEGSSSGVMVLDEGRYHQIRRMFETLGNLVVSLHRFRTGGLDLGDLPEGAWRFLDDADEATLFAG
ncbi:pseudouridine synthase [Emcibacter sp. SYSU 3D8]|uniref:pseudouridine synthase n=1 Tax=Emcibacter sp. SYSU 3D8 TaxID=3133969 RepID=UPI0031FEF1B3